MSPMLVYPLRQFALARRGFHWRDGVWRRNSVTLSDWTINHLPEATWQALLQGLDDPGCPTCGRAWAVGLV